MLVMLQAVQQLKQQRQQSAGGNIVGEGVATARQLSMWEDVYTLSYARFDSQAAAEAKAAARSAATAAETSSSRQA